MPTSDPKASLLLVDDTPANLLALEAVLEPLGQRLVTASSGDEALKHLLREEFAAVLLDVQMPGIDGFKTAELIRTREQTRYVPILFLTAVHREEAHILRGYTAGAVEYLVKPYNPDMLRAKVKVFVDLYLTSARLRQREALLRERERAEEEAHRTDLYSKLRAGEEQFRRIMESNLMGMLFTDFEGRALDANDAFLRTVGYSQDELLRGDVDERRLTPPEWAQAAEFAARELAERGVARPYEKEYVRRDGRRTPVVVASTRVESQARDIAFVLDITARKEAEARLRFLVDATATLSSSIDYETTLKTVAGLAVPTLADFCFVDLLEETGRVRRVAVANADPTQAAIAEQSRLYPPDLERNARHPAALALARSETVLMEGLGSEERVAMAQDPDHAELMQQAGIHSMVAVPLVARGRTLGVMTFLLAGAQRTYGPEDVSTAEDLVRRAALSVDNARLYAQAQDAVRARDEFLSVASHELKTPLTPLQLKLQQMRREAEGDGQQKPRTRAARNLALAEAQVRKLSVLVNDLLDVSRIGQSTLELHVEGVNFAEVVRDVTSQLTPQAARAGCQFLLQVPGSLQGTWDRARLEQVVTNLLTNAVKYGAGKPIQVRLQDGVLADRVRLTVQDEGIGIAPEALGRIWGKFERAVSDRHYGGLGLGLYIARQIVEALGGTVKAESHPGLGSTFTVELPRHALPPKHRPPR